MSFTANLTNKQMLTSLQFLSQIETKVPDKVSKNVARLSKIFTSALEDYYNQLEDLKVKYACTEEVSGKKVIIKDSKDGYRFSSEDLNTINLEQRKLNNTVVTVTIPDLLLQDERPDLNVVLIEFLTGILFEENSN